MKLLITTFFFSLIIGSTLSQNGSINKSKIISENELLEYNNALLQKRDQPQIALSIFRKYLKIFQKSNDQISSIECLYNMSGCYVDLDLNDSASQYIYQGINLSEINHYEAGVAKGRLRLANVHLSLGEVEQAVDEYLKSEPYFKLTNDSLSLTSIQINLCGCYGKLGELEKGLFYCNLSELNMPKVMQENILKREIQYKKTRINLNKALIYSEKKDTMLVLNALQKAYSMAKKDSLISILPDVCDGLGRAFYNYGNLDVSEKYLIEALDYSNKIENPSFVSGIYQVLSYIYEDKKDFQKAYIYLSQYNAFLDSANIIAQKNSFHKKELEYLHNKTKLEVNIKDASIRERNKLIIIIVLSFFLFISILYIILKKTRSNLTKEIKINSELNAKNQEIENTVKIKTEEVIDLQNQITQKTEEIEKASIELENKNKDIISVNKIYEEQKGKLTLISKDLMEKGIEYDKLLVAFNKELEKNEQIVIEKKKVNELLISKSIELNVIEGLLTEKNNSYEKIVSTLTTKNDELSSTLKLLEIKHNELSESSLTLINKNKEINEIEKLLDKKNEELVNYSILLAQKNEIINNSLEKINLLNTDSSSKIGSNIKAIASELKSSSNETTWREFEQMFATQHNEFYEKLSKLHPDLTQTEIRMCALLKLNMSTKEISSITLQTTRAIEVTRYRIRKKMNLSKEDNLTSFLKRNY